MQKFIGIGLVLVIIFALGVGWWQISHPSTVEIRAALDIGSGSTNMKIAKVNAQTDKIIAVLFETNIRVPYQKNLEGSSDMTFDKQTMDEGIKAIKTMKEIADQYHVKKVVAVATAAFRKAKNAEAFAEEIKKLTRVDVKIIDQDLEGILSFRAAVSMANTALTKAVVWDIGGGSMQLTAMNMDNYIVDKGTTASIPFKIDIIQKIEQQDPKVVFSPNPMNDEVIHQAIKLAEQQAQSASSMIKAKINEKGVDVLAVGTLFQFGIKPLGDGTNIITKDQLGKAVNAMEGKSDAQFPSGSLAEVAVSNPILVLGFMNALGIEKVTILNVNNADGALTYPPFWKN